MGTNGGISSRMGEKFYDAVEKIKDQKLRNGTSKERISTEKITNMMARHLSFWPICQEIIDSKEEEIKKYGL